MRIPISYHQLARSFGHFLRPGAIVESQSKPPRASGFAFLGIALGIAGAVFAGFFILLLRDAEGRHGESATAAAMGLFLFGLPSAGLGGGYCFLGTIFSLVACSRGGGVVAWIGLLISLVVAGVLIVGLSSVRW